MGCLNDKEFKILDPFEAEMCQKLKLLDGSELWVDVNKTFYIIVEHRGCKKNERER